jgi:hypothetical protein
MACSPEFTSRLCFRTLCWSTASPQHMRRDSRVQVCFNCYYLLPYRSTYLEPLLSPLLEHTSFSEAHFHPLTQSRQLLLHTHTGAPFTSPQYTRGLNLTLHTSPDCQVASLRLHVDWWGTVGRAGARYWTAVPGWAVGIVMWLMFIAMGVHERGGRTAAVICRPRPS